MCGIVGYINLNSKSIHDTSLIISMLKMQKHRGPDDSGIRLFSLSNAISEEVRTNEPQVLKDNFEGVLGFNRLSILDLSDNGHQPMVSQDGKVILMLNGELYNAFDFKKELIQWGYRFKSTSDTEVALALYLRYGFEELLERLNGMFAIVVVDLGRKELFITRDRFGIKPMYYINTGNTLAFSSELKCFRYVEGFDFRLEENQIDEYLIFRNNIQGTLYKGVYSLTPGHFISLNHEKGIKITRYFNINNYTRSTDTSGEISTYFTKLEHWLEKSVQSQLVSDVKLGCQLSGGIDSTLVTWLANSNSSKGYFESVSIVFNDPRFSEEKYIDIVSDKLEIKSHKFLLEPDYYLDNFEKATWHLEAPINHPNTVAIFKLSQRAKEHVTVLLSGEGADEIFGGYTRFSELCYPFKVKRLLHQLKHIVESPSGFFGYFNQEYRAVMATSFMSPETASCLKGSFTVSNAIEIRKSLYRSLSGSLFDRQVKYELLSYLPDLLIRQDKMSMAHSIENRVPFLDNEVVKNSFLIPEKYLILSDSAEGVNTEKYLLKKVAAAKFGTDFAFRNKMGFGIPLREFFLEKRFSQYIKDKVMPGIKTRGLFNYQIVSGWYENIKRLSYRELEALWIIVSFEIWASIYLDRAYEDSDTQL